MLASQQTTASSGNLSRELHLPATSRVELIEFIANELPRWRDRPDRPHGDGENVLTSQLCGHLNSAARHTPGWDFLQFRVEEPDIIKPSRKLDLVPAPCNATVWIEGRRHSDFDAIMPIECKRLPTPRSKERDEREYVFSNVTSTGGIQRFKLGQHGGSHSLGAMIAYIQDETVTEWIQRVDGWINQLVTSNEPGWTANDLLTLMREDQDKGISVLASLHSRSGGAGDIELRHIWLSMN